jgi:hypothetical protein
MIFYLISTAHETKGIHRFHAQCGIVDTLLSMVDKDSLIIKERCT